jgi:hypothetical protein
MRRIAATGLTTSTSGEIEERRQLNRSIAGR